MEGEVVTMTEIFAFERRGMGEHGQVLGEYRPTGMVPAFREALQNCLRLVQARLGTDLLPWLLHDDPKDEAVGRQLAETRHAQPALFAMSYALGAWLGGRLLERTGPDLLRRLMAMT